MIEIAVDIEGLRYLYVEWNFLGPQGHTYWALSHFACLYPASASYGLKPRISTE